MSPFDVLEVELDVDDAGVKRAYAKKVREHPPEKDPVGFQRVYEAFELLRDEDARARAARYVRRGSASTDADVLSRLDEAEAMKAGGRLEDAVQVLEVVTRRAPQLDTAWESLVEVLERLGGAEVAGPAAVRWAKERPSVLEAQLAAARLRTTTYDYDDARAALQVAHALAPYDRRVGFARAELERTREEWDVALTEISNALALPAEHVSDSRLRCARLRVNLERGATEAVQAELQRIDDAALLTAMGALAVSLRKIAVGAQIFDRARAVDPARKFFVPPVRTVPHAQLKPATREWVQARLANPPQRAVTFLLLLGTVRTPLQLFAGVGTAAALVSAKWIGAWSALLAIVGAGLFIVGYVKSTHPQFVGFLELRPLHLLHVTFETVTIIPLFRIASIGTSGYEVTVATDELPALRVSGPDAADLFVRGVLAQHHRLGTLASMDMLDTELEREPYDWSV